MIQKRFVILIIDGLGVGEMPDVKIQRPQDRGAHTLKNTISKNTNIYLPNLRSLNVINYFLNENFIETKRGVLNCSFGKFKLAHFGADSFMGHQEIAGSKPKKPLQQFIFDKKDAIISALKDNGINAQYNYGIIIVNNSIIISDNIESDYGFNMNVVGSLDEVSFDKILSIAEIVRSVVDVGRVITMGGKNITKDMIISCIEQKIIAKNSIYGINIPRLHIYNENYKVVHLGLEMDRSKQAPHIVGKKGYPVVFIGKAADVLTAENAIYHPAVHTEDVLDHLLNSLYQVSSGIVFANVQESDLAGHSPDVLNYSHHLELVDKALPALLKALGRDDIFVITGDHGNDPTIGHSFHTREYTPLILFSHRIDSQDFGTRNTLADIGASICSFFSLPLPEFGLSLI